jgi:hypothetical protein
MGVEHRLRLMYVIYHYKDQLRDNFLWYNLYL